MFVNTVRTAPVSFSYTCELAFFVNFDQSTAASGLYDGPLFTPAMPVVYRASYALKTRPVQYMIDAMVHVRKLSWTSLPAEHSKCKHAVLCTLVGSHCLTEAACEMTNYIVYSTSESTVMNDFWKNAFLYDYDCTTHVCESVGEWYSTRQVVPHQSSGYHHPPLILRFPARGKRVQRQLPDYRLPSSSSVHHFLASSSHHRPATGQSLVIFCLLLRFYVLVLFPRQ